MIKKVRRKLKRYIKKWLKNRSLVLLVAAGVFCLGIITYTYYMQHKRHTVDPMSYTPLLDLIGKAESKNNYNAYFGNPANQSVRFTDMSVADVQKWQQDFIKQGNFSSAVGKYQIIDTTLTELIKKLGINKNGKFDQSMQDTLAIALLERRGSEAFINGDLAKEMFAANLAKEWAGLPRIVGGNPADSYYASDGVNKALVKVDDVLNAIGQLKPQ